MKRVFISRFVLVIFSLFVLIACGGGSGSSSSTDKPVDGTDKPVDGTDKPSELSSSVINGVIKDIAGVAVRGATVQIENQSVQTGADGKYSLVVKFDGSKGSAVKTVTAYKKSYAKSSSSTKVENKKTSIVNLNISKNDIVTQIDSTKDNTVSVKDAKIEFSKDSFVKEDGTTYNGNVSVEATFNQPTTPTGQLTFPKPFEGLRADGGANVALQSYGFFNVEISDKDGKPLQLDKNSKGAKLSFPVDKNLKVTPKSGDSIPLWWYDTTKGIWIEEGVATYNDTTKMYEGMVKHFTSWNCDAPWPWGRVTGKVVDAQDKAVADALVKVKALSYYGIRLSTDSNGEFDTKVPAKMNVQIFASKGTSRTLSPKIKVATNETKNIAPIKLVDYNVDKWQSVIIRGSIKITDMPIGGYYISDLYIDANNEDSISKSHLTKSSGLKGDKFTTDDSKGVKKVTIKKLQENRITLRVRIKDEYSRDITYEKDVLVPADFSGEELDLGTVVLNASDYTSVEVNPKYKKEDGTIDDNFFSNATLYIDGIVAMGSDPMKAMLKLDEQKSSFEVKVSLTRVMYDNSGESETKIYTASKLVEHKIGEARVVSLGDVIFSKDDFKDSKGVAVKSDTELETKYHHPFY